jgi:hypothetical protein
MHPFVVQERNYSAALTSKILVRLGAVCLDDRNKAFSRRYIAGLFGKVLELRDHQSNKLPIGSPVLKTSGRESLKCTLSVPITEIH